MVQLCLLKQKDGRRGQGLGGGGDGQEIQGEAHGIPMKVTGSVRLELCTIYSQNFVSWTTFTKESLNLFI